MAEDIRAGRPQPGAVEIPIDQQYRRAEVEIPVFRTKGGYAPDPHALTKAAEALSASTRLVKARLRYSASLATPVGAPPA